MSLLKLLTASTAAGALALSGVSGTSLEPISEVLPSVSFKASDQAKNAQEQGIEAFRAILMLQGDNARALMDSSEYAVFTEVEKDELFAATNSEPAIIQGQEVVDQMLVLNPNSFEKLGKAINSKNPAQVKQALKSSTKTLLQTPIYKDAVEDASKNSTFIPGETNVAQPAAAVFVVVVVGAAAVIAVAAIGVAVVNFFAGANVGYAVNAKSKNTVSKSAKNFEISQHIATDGLLEAVQENRFVADIVQLYPSK